MMMGEGGGTDDLNDSDLRMLLYATGSVGSKFSRLPLATVVKLLRRMPDLFGMAVHSREQVGPLFEALPAQARDWILREVTPPILVDLDELIPESFDMFLTERLARELSSDPFVDASFVRRVAIRVRELACPDVVSFQALCVNPRACETLFNARCIDLGHVPIRWSFRIQSAGLSPSSGLPTLSGAGNLSEAFRLASLICGRPVRRLWIESLEDLLRPLSRYVSDFRDAFVVVRWVMEFLRRSVTQSEWVRLRDATGRIRRCTHRLHSQVGEALSMIDSLNIVDSPPGKQLRGDESVSDLTSQMKRLCTPARVGGDL
jgi:hypothetical protein